MPGAFEPRPPALRPHSPLNAAGAFGGSLRRRHIEAAQQAGPKNPGLPTYEWLAIGAVIINLLVSSNLLQLMGIPYAAEGGSPLVKFHPGTYLSIFAFGMFLMKDARPKQAFLDCISRSRTTAWYLLMIAIVCLCSLLTRGISGTAMYIETYVPAGLLLMIFESSNDRTRRMLGRLILACFILNVGVGIIENIVQKPLVPVFLKGKQWLPSAGEFRGPALYDHPLSGASFTMMAIFLALAIDIKALTKGIIVTLLLIGLLGFGGRTALGVTTVTLIGMGFYRLLRGGIDGTLSRSEIGAFLLAAVIVPVVLGIVLTQTTIGERIIAKLYWDDSAEVRLVQYWILTEMTPQELMFGTQLDRVKEMIFQIGLQMPFNDIENFWLLMFVNLGFVGFTFYLAGFLPFLGHAWRVTNAAGRIMIFTTILVASSSNSLGRKCNILTVLIPAVVATTRSGRREPVEAPRAFGSRAVMLRPSVFGAQAPGSVFPGRTASVGAFSNRASLGPGPTERS